MIVDDEEIVTASLGSLLQIEFDHEVVSFQSPRRALDHLQSNRVDMVISDFLMPDMNGLEFLREVKRLFPEVPRLMLTGYADKENAIRAINEVGLYQYLEKPWDNDQLKIVIRNGLEQSNLRQVLQQRVQELDRTLLEACRLREKTDLLQQELEHARRLQERLLPSTLPGGEKWQVSALWQPVFAIGGDFYDSIQLSDNRTAVLLADATGHGVQAALSTALVKFAFSRSAGSERGPVEILEDINAVLFDGLPTGIFVAALVLTIDSDGRHCHIANAGTPHPLILKRSGGDESNAVRRLPAEGLLLGVADPGSFKPGEEHCTDLQSGDGLLMFTDGVTEAENAREEQFEQKELHRVLNENRGLQGQELLHHLGQAVREHCNGAAPEDDITMILLEKH